MLPVHIAFGLIMGLLLVGARTRKERRMAVGMCVASVLVWSAITGIEDGTVSSFFGGGALAAANLAVGLIAGRLFGHRLNKSPRANGRK